MQGPGAMMVVVMEFCDLQSLHRAITKKVFKPHGKFSKQATYVSRPQSSLLTQHFPGIRRVSR